MCHLMDIAVSANNRVKRKEGKTLDQYLNLHRDQERLWNAKVMITLISVDALGTVPKNLEKKNLTNWRLEKELRLSKAQHF